jgi:hypothetical protein
MARWLDGSDRKDLLAAIARFAMPYEPDPVPEVANFFDGYRQLVPIHAPDLVVQRQPNSGGVRPSGSNTIYFETSKCLPRYDFLPTLRFSHQCRDSGEPSASVKVMIAGWGRHFAKLARSARIDLSTGPIYIRPAGKSLGLVIDTPTMNNQRPVAGQINGVLTGLRAAMALRAWMFEHGEVLKAWGQAIG